MNGGRIVIVSLCLVAMAACGGGSGGSGGDAAGGEPAASSTSPPETTPPETAPPTGSPTPEGSTGALRPPTSTKEVEADKDVSVPPIVTGARYAGHPGFDRVVIDLDGAVPGYTVRWVDEVVQDGSGEGIEVDGGAYLQVTLHPANAHDEDGTSTWRGGPVFPADLTNVRSVVRNGDFEAVVSVAIALDHRAPFRVLEQRSPTRLVIDVAH
jgi:hypothetical protein